MNTYKGRKSRTSGAIALLLALALLLPLFGAPAEGVNRSELNALKQQQAQLAEQRAGLQAQANALSSQMDAQNEKLELLAEQLELTNQEIEILSEQLAIYTNTVAEMENQLAVDKRKEQELLRRYKVRVRAMEEGGDYSYITILLGAANFQDLLSRIDCVRSIMKFDSDLIGDVQEAQEKVRAAKTEMEAQMEAQAEVFEEYQAKQVDLLAQQEAAQAVLESLAADSAEYAQQLESVRALQAAMGTQISNMEAQLAEQERIRAEQNASNNISSGNNWYGDTTGSGTGQDIVNYAMGFLGVPYVYGGTSPSGFDCSGLVYYCYKHYGYSLNRTAAGLAYNGTSVSSTALQVGDIILFTSTNGSYIGHTGIYVGGGQFIHAPHTGDVVKISNLSDTYYTNHYYGARRVIA
jgi:cell wall-associated NlpC family hydrolase